uniref:Ig-like domain-containing protein n=1 Tax=Pygocentrus nattereri TaxID=42514 RepID=A0AAR2KYM7_PYGNA
MKSQTLRDILQEICREVARDARKAATAELKIKQSKVSLSLYFQPVLQHQVGGQEGGSVSVQCLYSAGYKNKQKKWCRFKDWTCFTVGRTTTSQNSAGLVSDDRKGSVSVEMSGLQKNSDSGYYWCAVEISGGSDDGDYVYLTVSSGKTVMLAGTGSVQEMWGLLFTSLSLKDLQVRSHVSEILFIPADHQAVMLFHSHHFISYFQQQQQL